MGQCLGLAGDVSDAALRSAVISLLGDPSRRREMHTAGLMTIDGQGAARIATDLSSRLAEKRATDLQTARR
jgi:hypothetical protein